MEKSILNFHFDYLNPSLIVDITDVIIIMIAEVIAASTILVKVGDCPCGNHMTGLEDSRAAEEMNRVLSQVNLFLLLDGWCDMRRIAGPVWISGPQPTVAGADNLEERQRQDGISNTIIAISLEAHSHHDGMSLNSLVIF